MQDNPGKCLKWGKKLVPVGMLGSNVILWYACDQEDNSE